MILPANANRRERGAWGYQTINFFKMKIKGFLLRPIFFYIYITDRKHHGLLVSVRIFYKRPEKFGIFLDYRSASYKLMDIRYLFIIYLVYVLRAYPNHLF